MCDTQKELYQQIVDLSVKYIIADANNTQYDDDIRNSMGNKIDRHAFIFKLNKDIATKLKELYPPEMW